MARHLVSIWFFIGLLLDIYGVLILGWGIYELIHPSNHPVKMDYLHAGIWWGIVLLLLGLAYTVKFAPAKDGNNRHVSPD